MPRFYVKGQLVNLAPIDDYLLQLQNPGDDGIPETIYDDILAEYNNDLSIRDNKVNEHAEAMKAKDVEISRLKSLNYDMLILQSAENGSVDESENEPDDEPQGVDSLFEENK